MPSFSRQVYSSMVKELSYDAETKELTVVWSKGGTGMYEGVPEDVADELSRAASVGDMIHREFKGVYAYRRL